MVRFCPKYFKLLRNPQHINVARWIPRNSGLKKHGDNGLVIRGGLGDCNTTATCSSLESGPTVRRCAHECFACRPMLQTAPLPLAAMTRVSPPFETPGGPLTARICAACRPLAFPISSYVPSHMLAMANSTMRPGLRSGGLEACKAFWLPYQTGLLRPESPVSCKILVRLLQHDPTSHAVPRYTGPERAIGV